MNTVSILNTKTTCFFRLRFLCVVGIVIATSNVGRSESNLPPSVLAEEASWNQWTSQKSWVFLGDSNTYAGGYVAILDAWLTKVAGSDRPKLLNLGMSSETVAGTSEVDHPFKRPCLHERLDKVLAMTKPGVVFMCYGMNDGIYEPPSKENFAAYQDGMHRAAEKIRQSGALLVVITPPIFEPEPVAAKEKFGPTPEGRYAWFAPYNKYDDVVKEQTQWCLKNSVGANLVIDIRSMLQQAKKERLAEQPDFAFTGDGVHFHDEAHGLVAENLLRALKAPEHFFNEYPTEEELAVGNQKMKLLRDAYLAATGKNRPNLPAGFPVWYAEQLVSSLAKGAP